MHLKWNLLSSHHVGVETCRFLAGMSFKPLHPECSNLFRFPKPFFSIGCMQSLLKFSFKQNEHSVSSYMVLVVPELEFLKLAAACWEEEEETRSRDKQFVGRACEEKRGKEDGERRRRNPGTLRSALCRNMWMGTNKELHQNLYSPAAAAGGRTTSSSSLQQQRSKVLLVRLWRAFLGKHWHTYKRILLGASGYPNPIVRRVEKRGIIAAYFGPSHAPPPTLQHGKSGPQQQDVGMKKKNSLDPATTCGRLREECSHGGLLEKKNWGHKEEEDDDDDDNDDDFLCNSGDDVGRFLLRRRLPVQPLRSLSLEGFMRKTGNVAPFYHFKWNFIFFPKRISYWLPSGFSFQICEVSNLAITLKRT